MKILKYIVLFYCIFFTVTSCSVNINFSLQGLYSYYSKTKKLNPYLFKNNETGCNFKYDHHVYVTNGAALRNCIRKEPKSLIYIWGPHCKSELCLSLDTVQEICDKKNIKLYVVAEYYDSESMRKPYHIEFPVFGIDTRYYHTDLTSKYLSKFIKDTGAIQEIGKRYLYFEKGNFVGSYKDIYKEDVL